MIRKLFEGYKNVSLNIHGVQITSSEYLENVDLRTFSQRYENKYHIIIK